MRRVGYPNLGGAGRLGNALWEVASTLGFARARNTDPVFPTWDYAPYFSCPPLWFDDEAIGRCLPATDLTGLPGIQRHYMQQWSFIAPVIDEVREVFAPSPLALTMLAEHLEATGQTDVDFAGSVSLHVRRGDNTNPDTHPRGTWPLVTHDYYRTALDRLPGMPVVVFSEDPGWVRDNWADLFAGRQVHYMTPGPVRPPDYFPAEYAASDPTDWIDLALISRCGAHVNANSTYSYWGALLEGGPTVYPSNWVGFACRFAVPDEATICPPWWTMLLNPVDRSELVP